MDENLVKRTAGKTAIFREISQSYDLQSPNIYSLHLCGEPSGSQDRRGVIIRIHSRLRSLRVVFAPQPRRFRFRVPLSRVRLPLINSFRRISIYRLSIVTACVRCARRSRDRTTAATATMTATAAATSTYLGQFLRVLLVRTSASPSSSSARRGALPRRPVPPRRARPRHQPIPPHRALPPGAARHHDRAPELRDIMIARFYPCAGLDRVPAPSLRVVITTAPDQDCLVLPPQPPTSAHTGHPQTQADSKPVSSAPR